MRRAVKGTPSFSLNSIPWDSYLILQIHSIYKINDVGWKSTVKWKNWNWWGLEIEVLWYF